MGENATLQIGRKFALDIGWQACGVGIGVERGEKGLQMVRDDLLEHGGARIAWDVGGHRRSHDGRLRLT
jgi:hypothetical protein